MAIDLNRFVTKADDDTWTLTCPVTDGTCGDRETGVPFTSSEWPTKKLARARLDEHVAEHKGEGVMSSLEEFRRKHGLHVNADGKAVVTAKDL